MRRELLLIHEMIEAATRVRSLIGDLDAGSLFADRDRREAPLWNYTVLGEASSQVPDDVRTAFPQVEWVMATRLRNRIVHGYWEIDFETLHARSRYARAALTWLANAEGGYSTSGGHPAAHNRPYGRKLHGFRP